MNDDFLAGTSVLDLGRWYAAPLAARLLGDFGAEVIRVEPPEGDPTRAEGPFPPGFEGHPDHSGVYHYFNGGKLGVTLDVASKRGRGLLGELIARADVVVSDRLPAEARALRLTWDDVREANPNAVLLSITPWGLDGPYSDYRAYPMNELHASGAAYALGTPDREPITLPGPQSSYMAGANGAGAAVTALYGRDITGEGQLVDISTIETVTTVLMGHAVVKAHHLGERTMRTGHRLAGMAPHTHFPCKDGLLLRHRHAAAALGAAQGRAGPARLGRVGAVRQRPLALPLRRGLRGPACQRSSRSTRRRSGSTSSGSAARRGCP